MATPTAYGVLYAPLDNSISTPESQTKKSPPPSLDALLAPSIAFVRVQWVDYTNTVRFRVLPARFFRTLLSAPRPALSLTKATLGIVGLRVAPGFSGGAVGEYLYVPDLASWRVCSYAPGHAAVMGWFEEKKEHEPGRGLGVPLCPRTMLARLVREAHEHAAVSFLVGVESEFILLHATAPEPVYANAADWSCAAKTRTGSVEARVLEEIAACLLDAGIELQMYHAEAAPGQFEVVTGPLPPLEAADALVFTRETIYNIAHKHGLKATFSPRLHNDSCGSGAHTHISVHGSPLPSRASDAPLAPSLTPTERSFLQGLLTHLRAVCALTLPNAASYARVLDGIWSGGTYACWGTDNREAPVRVCGASGHAHFEVKCVDGTSCPYLAVGAIVAAGARGVRERLGLGTGDCRKAVAEMTEGERVEVGLGEPVRLPRSVREAREALAGDGAMREVLGGEFVEKYLGVNETMEEFMTGKDEKETVRKLIEYF